MSQRACLWAPSPMLDSILVTFIQHLDKIHMFTSTILPMQLTNLVLAVEKVETTLTASTATGTDLAETIRRNLDLVNLILSEGLATILGIMKLATS